MRLYAGHYLSSNSNHIFKAFKAEIHSGLVSIELNILVVHVRKSKLVKVKKKEVSVHVSSIDCLYLCR